MGECDDVVKNIIFSGNYGWRSISISTRGLKVRFRNLELHPGEIKGKVTPDMLDELENYYRDLMAVCYPEISRVEFFFINQQVRDGDDNLILPTSLCRHKVKYYIAFMLFTHYSENRRALGFKIANTQLDGSIPLEETPIDRHALIEELKRLIRFVEHDRQLEISDELVMVGTDNVRELQYRIIGDMPSRCDDEPDFNIELSEQAEPNFWEEEPEPAEEPKQTESENKEPAFYATESNSE
jgi:hypothetical protein